MYNKLYFAWQICCHCHRSMDLGFMIKTPDYCNFVVVPLYKRPNSLKR